MIQIQAAEGTAEYNIDPYAHWTGDDAMAERGEALLVLINRKLLAQGMDPDANDRSRQVHRAFELACLESGITVVKSELPPLDPLDDPYETMIKELERAKKTGV